MEALHNFISSMILSSSKMEIQKTSAKPAYQSSCAQDMTQNSLNGKDMGVINKRKNSYSGFSMPNLKENLLQTLIM
jgi:hypothetical protein